MSLITAKERYLPSLTHFLSEEIAQSVENLYTFHLEISNSKKLLPEHIETEIKKHLQVLSKPFQGYFYHGEVSGSLGWMQDPYVFNFLASLDVNDKMKEDLVEIKASNTFKLEFESMQ